jgi:hypothetical protein
MLSLFKQRTMKNELAAGPDLDRKVARLLGADPDATVPAYSTDDACAIALAERFSKEWSWWRYEKREVDGGWSVGWIAEKEPLLRSVRPIQATAPTRALAICLSILRVAESIADRRDRVTPLYEPPELRG